MSIETYSAPRDLEAVGIRVLTGEACGLAMRILCDLDDSGLALWQEFTRTTPMTDSWNSGPGSIMIPSSLFQDLWIFAMVRKAMQSSTPSWVFLGGYCFGKDWTETHYESIDVTHRHPVKTWTPDAWAVFGEEDVANVRGHVERGSFYVARSFTASKQPGTGLDNTHAMSGRTT
jgi:hypothetical protein